MACKGFEVRHNLGGNGFSALFRTDSDFVAGFVEFLVKNMKEKGEKIEVICVE